MASASPRLRALPSGLLLLVLLSLLAASSQFATRRQVAPLERVSPQLRLLEWRLVWAEGRPGGLTRAAAELEGERLAPWDALALGAWLGARGEAQAAERCLSRIPAGSLAARALAWARDPRSPLDGDTAQRLGHSLAGGLARGQGAAELREGIHRQIRLGGLIAGSLVLIGLGTVAWLLGPGRKGAAPTPAPALSGRDLLQTFLLWFLALQASGFLFGPLLGALPFLRPLGLPLAYAFHGTVALLALRGFLGGKGLSRESWRIRPQLPAWVLGFAGVGALGLMAAGWGIGPWWPFRETPQAQLAEHLARASGLELGAFFLTAAGLAPLLEEFLFRGVLQPWLGARIGPGAAILATGLAFGAFHLEPGAFPTLTVLGLVFGWAAWRSGSLWPPILLHALWNGGLVWLNRAYLAP